MGFFTSDIIKNGILSHSIHQQLVTRKLFQPITFVNLNACTKLKYFSESQIFSCPYSHYPSPPITCLYTPLNVLEYV